MNFVDPEISTVTGPVFQLSKSQLELQARARELAQGHVASRAAEVDRTEEYPWDTIEKFTENGFTGMTLPPELGEAGTLELRGLGSALFLANRRRRDTSYLEIWEVPR